MKLSGKNIAEQAIGGALGTVIVGVVTFILGYLLTFLLEEFGGLEEAVSKLWYILPVAVVALLLIWPRSRRYVIILGKFMLSTMQRAFQWMSDNILLVAGVGLLLSVSCCIFIATNSLLQGLSALGLGLASFLFVLWFNSTSQRRSDPKFLTLELSGRGIPNAALDNLYSNLPTGEVDFGGVKFLLKPGLSVIHTRASRIEELDRSVRIELRIPDVKGTIAAVHFLINSTGSLQYHDDTNTWLEWSTIGSIELFFGRHSDFVSRFLRGFMAPSRGLTDAQLHSNKTTQNTDLVLGDNIREWAVGNDPERLVTRVDDPACQLAWKGRTVSGNYAVIDRLRIPVFNVNKGKRLEKIVIVRHIPQHPTLMQAPNWHLLVSAITLELEPWNQSFKV